MLTRSLAAIALAFSFTGCTDGSPDDSDHDHDHGIDAVLQFEATLDGNPAACDAAIATSPDGPTAVIADARMYVSGIEVRNADGGWVEVTLEDDGMWQHMDIALLDFEDGSGACADSGNSDLNDQVTGSVPEGSYDAVRFDVGVPFAMNHNDSATAPPPLNAPGMFWTWQGGYKFVRVDFAVQSDPPARWNIHIGSTGCESAAPTEAPAAECGRPNRATITLEGLDPLSDAIDIDLGALVAGADLTSNVVDTPPGCMSNPMEPDDCTAVFDSLGLDFATGTCAGDCSNQAVFR
jgi:uncharacterized repeat protein (TIGR04052 family)